MIGPLVAAGHRVVAPDLPGFGRSDKPMDPATITYANLVAWMGAWLEQVDLRHITVFCQDWGGLVGLRVLSEHADRFDRLVVSNTLLPTGGDTTDAIAAWVDFSQAVDPFEAGAIVQLGSTRTLEPDEVAAYDAPFPTEQHKAAPRRMPLLVPTDPVDPEAIANRAAWSVLERWTKPTLVAFSDSDPITSGGHITFLERIPGTRDVEGATIGGAGHFLQVDSPEELGRLIVDLIART